KGCESKTRFPVLSVPDRIGDGDDEPERMNVLNADTALNRDETKEWKDNDPPEGAGGDKPNICVRLFVLLFGGFDANLTP
ncbi:hypothetical protein ALC56_09427, partial [Trachymyrmex septentrionalis]